MSWLEIKKSLNSDLDTPLNVTLGKKTDTAGTSTSSSLFSWVKQIFTTLSSVSSSVSTINTKATSIDSNTSRGTVKSIQRGTTVADTVALSTINPAKAFVILNWQLQNTGGPSTVALFNVPYVISLTSTLLTIGPNKVISPSGGNMTTGNVSWQVIEYY